MTGCGVESQAVPGLYNWLVDTPNNEESAVAASITAASAFTIGNVVYAYELRMACPEPRSSSVLMFYELAYPLP